MSSYWKKKKKTTFITSESRLALTDVFVMPIHAGAAVLARFGLAFVFFLLTVSSHPASLTLTNVALHKKKKKQVQVYDVALAAQQ